CSIPSSTQQALSKNTVATYTHLAFEATSGHQPHLARMISRKGLVEMARTWAEYGNKRKKKNISWWSSCSEEQQRKNNTRRPFCSLFSRWQKAHGVMVPLSYLHLPIFQELLRMAEEEFGLDINGAIIFPCDSAFIEYVMFLLRRDLHREVENVLMALFSRQSCSASSSLPHSQPGQQVLLCVI
ncbi:hypothetical protein EJ110_NYTH18545, partial [Nymphaea thermarum]